MAAKKAAAAKKPEVTKTKTTRKAGKVVTAPVKKTAVRAKKAPKA